VIGRILPAQRLEQKKRILLIVSLLLLAVGIAVALNRVPFIRQKSDIFLRWYATRQLLQEDRNLYDARNGVEVHNLVYGEGRAERETNFYYPAILLVVTAPLSLLPYPAAHLLWTILGQLFFLGGVGLLIWATGYRLSTNRLSILLYALVLSVPYLQHAIWGQFNTIAVFSLALCLVALARNRDWLAGISAAGLLFKPHSTLLTLLFLLFWVFFRERRWRFYGGFGFATALLWGVAELMNPGWVTDFYHALGGYIAVTSVVDRVWNPYQVTTIALLLAGGAVFVWQRRAPLDSTAFAAAFTLSLTLWALVLPVAGAFHVMILPVAIILLLAAYQRVRPAYERYLAFTLLTIYVAGWLGFLAGLARPEWYGLHITLVDLAYTALLPVALALFALPLLAPSRVGILFANGRGLPARLDPSLGEPRA
jgi:hypothetical protein